MDFSDRYLILYPAIDINTLDTLSPDQLNSLYPELFSAIEAVRRHSVLISKKRASEIYYAITEHADPRIGLVLAAARDKAGAQLFPTSNIVKHFMFDQFTNDSIDALVEFNQRNIFYDGIKRVSIALAAALLIGQLAQIPEQQRHSEYLEKEAISDLNRILEVPELSKQLIDAQQESKDKEEKKSFYFEDTTFTLTTPLELSIFITGQNSWTVVQSYTGTVSTMRIVADIADYINSFTLQLGQSNIVASPVLASGNEIHEIEFNSRQRDEIISYELVSVRFNETTVPFQWGVTNRVLKDYPLNSLILTTLQSRVQTTAPQDEEEQDKTLSVLYIRPVVGAAPTGTRIVYRVSPTMDENREIDIPISGGDRNTLATTALLNDLFSLRDSSRVLGSIIQNDPTGSIIQYSALQLVAYSATFPQTEMILDILEIPDDLEIALGTRLAPVTSFSNKPRSITVKTVYDRTLRDSSLLNTTKEGTSILARAKKSSIVEKLQDIRDRQRINYSNYRYKLPDR